MANLFGEPDPPKTGDLFGYSSHAAEPIDFEAPAPTMNAKTPERPQPQAAQWPRPWYYQTPQQRRQDAKIAKQYRPDGTPGMF